MGLFDAPYVDEDRAREVLADPAHRDVARVAAERSAVLLRNEGDLLPLDAGSLTLDRGDRPAGRLAARHPRAMGVRLRPGRDGDRAGRDPRQRSGTGSGSITPAGVPVVQRMFPSLFDMFGGQHGRGSRRVRRARPSSQHAVDLAARRRRRGRRRRGVAEHDRRGGLAVVAGAARAPARAAAGRGRDRHAGRAAGDERPTAGPALARRARAGHPRHLVSRHPGRRRLWRTCCSAMSRPAASSRSPGRAPWARCRWCTRTPGRTSPRTRGAATGTRPARRCSRSATASATAGSSTPTSPSTGPPSPADGSVTVSVDVTNTADREADEVVQLYLHQRHGSASRPVRELKGFARVTLAAGETRTLEFPRRPGRAALLERRGPGLGDRPLDLRRLGGR